MNNPTLDPKHHAFEIRLGQRPLTHFKDYSKSIKVRLIKHDDRNQMLKGTYKFVKATWTNNPSDNDNVYESDMEEAIIQMLSGKALGLGLETINLMFEISGITRIDTHQIVRQRIGCTFSQQCSGDRFWTHHDALVEPSIAVNELVYEDYIVSTLKAKQTYSEMVDQGISIQAARSILPHNLETFIYMNTNLMTLLFFHQKRIDDGSQTWSINEVARQMADGVCKVYPELIPVFEKNSRKFKFQEEASKDRTNTFSTNLYLPKDDTYEYNIRDFLYDKKKLDMHLPGNEVKDRYFWGYDELTSDLYNRIKNNYNELDKEIKLNHYTNEEIITKARQVNAKYDEHPKLN